MEERGRGKEDNKGGGRRGVEVTEHGGAEGRRVRNRRTLLKGLDGSG